MLIDRSADSPLLLPPPATSAQCGEIYSLPPHFYVHNLHPTGSSLAPSSLPLCHLHSWPSPGCWETANGSCYFLLASRITLPTWTWTCAPRTHTCRNQTILIYAEWNSRARDRSKRRLYMHVKVYRDDRSSFSHVETVPKGQEDGQDNNITWDNM